jgi:hypothetical protein
LTGLPQRSFYLCALSIGHIISFRKISYTICGSEVLSLNPANFAIEKSLFVGNISEPIEFKGYFVNSMPMCEISRYSIVNSQFENYSGTIVQINHVTSKVEIKTDKAIEMLFYIQA